MKLPWQKPKIQTQDIEGIITHIFIKMTAHKVRKDQKGHRKSPGYLDSFVNQIFETFKANYPGFYREEYRKPLRHLVECFVALEAIERE